MGEVLQTKSVKIDGQLIAVNTTIVCEANYFIVMKDGKRKWLFTYQGAEIEL